VIDMTYKPSKLGHTDLVYLVCDQSSSVDLCIQDYKFLHVGLAVMICDILVNTQADSF